MSIRIPQHRVATRVLRLRRLAPHGNIHGLRHTTRPLHEPT